MPAKVYVPSYIEKIMAMGAALAVSLSAGKDSHAMLIALVKLHRERGWTGKIFALHLGLGRAEWDETPEMVSRIARESGLELVFYERKQGDLVQDIEGRLDRLKGTGKPFWPSAAARYCTAHHKRGQADIILRGYPELVVNAMGFRADESAGRKSMGYGRVRKQITAKWLREMSPEEAFEQWSFGGEAVQLEPGKYGAEGYGRVMGRLAYDWHPIYDWDEEDVWETCGTSGLELYQRQLVYQEAWKAKVAGRVNEYERLKAEALAGWPCHPAYVYGNTRLSCSLCILASKNDLLNGARHNPWLLEHYIALEVRGNATFKQGFSLSEIDVNQELVPKLAHGHRHRQMCLF